MFYFYLIFSVVILQRILELKIAQKNERWMKARSGIEVGRKHYPLFIYLHILFFVSLYYEVIKKELIVFQIVFFIIFVIAQIGRFWCITSLGKFWNTKIIVIPNVIMIRKGPYRWIKHPNYVIVFIELFSLPLTFNAYIVAIIFPILHILLLLIRIPEEEKALAGKIN